MNAPAPPSDPGLVPLCSLRVDNRLVDAGLVVAEDFVSAAEAEELLRAIDALPWDATLKRRTQHYGRRFDYLHKSVGADEQVEPLPECIRALVMRLMAHRPLLVPWRSMSTIQCTVNEYLPGVGIASHVDTHSAFEDGIAALTLSAGCAFRMQRAATDASEAADVSVWLPPRSMLVMAGAARYEWRHSISGRKYDRVQSREAQDLAPATCAAPAADLAADSSELVPDAGWTWVPRGRRVSVTIRSVLSSGTCNCGWPLLCDSRPNGARPLLPTRIHAE